MSDKDFLFNYDKENDILFIYHSRKKSKGSIEYGENIHIAFSPEMEVIGLEMLDASKFLSAITKTKVGRKGLANIVRCRLTTKTKRGLLFLKFILFIKNKQPIEEHLLMQDINYHSPLVEYA